ncbi:MAG: BCD family MFS transporter [Polymorphobacter sp.]|uniref:BCD family MFS transporter n=1 Tax=Polymorphobacter sp. TaxID=1909290 RepID=UPI003A84CC83
MATASSAPPAQKAGVRFWAGLGTKFLPFADAASDELPLSRLLRLSLFQVSVGLAMVLLNATLNRVMIVELGISATAVAILVALPLLFAPVRAMIGHKSDNHASFLGWKRVPYIWAGTMLQFAGLAIMPFALLVMTGRGEVAGANVGEVFGALAFLMVGAGVAVTQTAGLALANDLAPKEVRPRVVSLLYVMLLVGMFISSVLIGQSLRDFSETRLVEVIQGTAVVTVVLNVIALWKQEARVPGGVRPDEDAPDFAARWDELMAAGPTKRLLIAIGLGAAGFGMQDILLEPFGGQILGMSVAATTGLTALSSVGTLVGLALAARFLWSGGDPARMAGLGAFVGIFAFAVVIFSAPLQSPGLFGFGAMLIGLGNGLFAVCTLTAAMALSDIGGDSAGKSGLALGAWGAVQASAVGLGILLSGAIRDGVGALAMKGALGPGLVGASTGYSMVWHIEIALLFMSLIALGPLARRSSAKPTRARFGLTEFPT